MPRLVFALGDVAPPVRVHDGMGWTRALRMIALALALLLANGAPAGAADAASPPESPPPALAVGDALPPLPLRDQHGGEARIGDSTRTLLFTRDMDGGAFVKEALAEDGSAMLSAAQAVYVSDVSRMPGFVRSAFALPSLRRRSYAVALDETGVETRALPYREGRAAILSLESGRITAISFASSSAEVRAALGK